MSCRTGSAVFEFCLCSSSVACLTSQDSAGETALHSAVKSKASGLARFFSKLASEQPDQKVLDLLGLKPLMVSSHLLDVLLYQGSYQL